MPSQNRELTGREKQRIKKLITSLCANYDIVKRNMDVCRWTATVPCSVSATQTAPCAGISAAQCCRPTQSCKLCFAVSRRR